LGKVRGRVPCTIVCTSRALFVDVANFSDRVCRDVIPDIIDNNYSLSPPDFNKVAVIEAKSSIL
jgi:hypothetical protein